MFIPSYPFVPPHACNENTAFLIVSLSDALTLSKTILVPFAYVTSDIVSRSSSLLRSKFKDFFTSGSLFSENIEPETSIKNTKLLGLRSSIGISSPLIEIIVSLLSEFHGHTAVSEDTEKGVPSSGRG